jgi:hypothetical protein
MPPSLQGLLALDPSGGQAEEGDEDEALEAAGHADKVRTLEAAFAAVAGLCTVVCVVTLCWDFDEAAQEL